MEAARYGEGGDGHRIILMTHTRMGARAQVVVNPNAADRPTISNGRLLIFIRFKSRIVSVFCSTMDGDDFLPPGRVRLDGCLLGVSVDCVYDDRRRRPSCGLD